MQFKLDDIKKMVEGFVPKETKLTFLDERYNMMRNSQGYIAPYYRFFFELTKRFKPKVVVELGSWQGTSAAHFAGGCKETTVITIDHHSDPGDIDNGAKTYEAALEFENLHYIQGWTCDKIYKEEIGKHQRQAPNAYPSVKKALGKKKIDILFIDSWHRYDQAMKDWNAYSPLLADEALVICDDIIPGTKGGGIEDMDKFWKGLKGEKFLDSMLHQGFPIGFYKWKKSSN